MYNTNGGTYYSCAKMGYSGSVSDSGFAPASCSNSSGMTAEYIADTNQLANGSEAAAGSIDRTVSPFASTSSSAGISASSPASSASSASPSASPTTTSTSSSTSSLSTGAKTGIGVAVPLTAIIIAIYLFVCLRRRRRRRRRANKNSTPSNPDHLSIRATADKPELSGSSYDPTIAGLVNPRTELSSGRLDHELAGKLHPSATHRELPGTVGANTRRSHVNTSHSPPELGRNSAASEINFDATRVGGGGDGAGARSKMAAGSDAGAGAGAPASSVGSIIRRPVSTVTDGEAEGLAEEADLLVQELGLIQMRKKALGGIAKGKGVKPEELPGRRGEDYRDLLVREARVKERIDKIDSARTGGAS